MYFFIQSIYVSMTLIIWFIIFYIFINQIKYDIILDRSNTINNLPFKG